VSLQIVCNKFAAFAFAAFTVFAAQAAAQRPTVVVSDARTMSVAERNNVYCAGYVQTAPIDTSRKIVGAVDEQEQFMYGQNNFVYINAGANRGVSVGDVMTVLRPRGQVKTRWTRKGNLGAYVQEVGALEIIRVKNEVSVARVRTSCDNLLLGDLVQPMPVRVAPQYRQRPALDLFGDPSGKAVGRLFMARDNVEAIARDFIVYIDLGAEDNVQVATTLRSFARLARAARSLATGANRRAHAIRDFKALSTAAAVFRIKQRANRATTLAAASSRPKRQRTDVRPVSERWSARWSS
jgi:hypothetical protein